MGSEYIINRSTVIGTTDADENTNLVNNDVFLANVTADKTKGGALGSDPETRVYAVRWYILFVFSLATVLQSAAWALWGPISQSAKATYGWTDSTITILVNLGNIGILVSLVPAAYIANVYGLRTSVVLANVCITIGSGLKLLPLSPLLTTISIGAGQFINGIGASVMTVLPAAVSETWFPCSERSTATALAIVSNSMGGMVAFVLAPALVSQPVYNSTNTTNTTTNDGDAINISEMHKEIDLLLLIELVWAAALLFFSVVYFPNKPALPPSVSAGHARLQFRKAFYELVINPSVVLVTIVCAVPWACFGNWISLLSVVLEGIGVTQTEAGWYGFYACLSGTVSGIIVGRIIDAFRRQHKPVACVLYVLALLSIVIITLICAGYLPRSRALEIVSINLLSFTINGAVPIFFEAACELGYPAGEEMVGLFIGLGQNAAGVIFLLAGFIPSAGTAWMNWAITGVIVASLPLLLLTKMKYSRTIIDAEREPKDILSYILCCF